MPFETFLGRLKVKVNHICLSFMQFIQRNRHKWHHFTHFSIAVDDKMAAKLFSSQK